ncbi:MAG: class F sortase [bacterium]|nr:class F sortase [bacterium]
MRLKIVLRRILFIVAPAGFVLFLALFLDFLPQDSNLAALSTGQAQSGSVLSENTVALPKQEHESFGLPVRLKIPRINVDAPIEHVGLAPDGAMDVPKERVNVAWFNLGPRPGEGGSAVIAGHFGWRKDKEASVFDNLHTLRRGDKIYIEDEKGEIISFVVRESRRYNPNADASGVFGSYDGKSHLNLITCEGVWDRVSKTYSKRLVVFTDRE